jgi:chromosome segregation ATPase
MTPTCDLQCKHVLFRLSLHGALILSRRAIEHEPQHPSTRKLRDIWDKPSTGPIARSASVGTPPPSILRSSSVEPTPAPAPAPRRSPEPAPSRAAPENASRATLRLLALEHARLEELVLKSRRQHDELEQGVYVLNTDAEAKREDLRNLMQEYHRLFADVNNLESRKSLLYADNTHVETELQSKQSQLSTLKAQFDEFYHVHAARQNELNALQSSLDDKSSQLKKATTELHDARTASEEYYAQMDDARRDLETVRADLRASRDALKAKQSSVATVEDDLRKAEEATRAERANREDVRAQVVRLQRELSDAQTQLDKTRHSRAAEEAEGQRRVAEV